MNYSPIIGITLDYETQESYAKYPWYALRENYVSAVHNHGGTAILLPYLSGAANQYMSMIDGLIITGGAFDIPPEYYGEEIQSDQVIIKNNRTAFEITIAKLAFEMKKPILGICGGQQLLNVIFGGSLIQHIPDYNPDALIHEQKIPKHLPSHEIILEKNSLLYKIVGKSQYSVNSTHHQAVKQSGKDLIINARATDNIIEGIEHTNHPFCLGLQWHPEYCTIEEDSKIFQSFIEVARNGRV